MNEAKNQTTQPETRRQPIQIDQLEGFPKVFSKRLQSLLDKSRGDLDPHLRILVDKAFVATCDDLRKLDHQDIVTQVIEDSKKSK